MHSVNSFQSCGTNIESTPPSALNKRIMLVSDFYYGRFEGDGIKKDVQKTTTFKCQSCLKVLKNNIRYDLSMCFLLVKYLWGVFTFSKSYDFSTEKVELPPCTALNVVVLQGLYWPITVKATVCLTLAGARMRLWFSPLYSTTAMKY